MTTTAQTATWIQEQVTDGAAMADLWEPMLVRAWQENNAAARTQLAALTIQQVATFAGGSRTPALELLVQWQQDRPDALAALRCVLAAGADGPSTISRTARELLERLWSLAADRGLDPVSVLAEAVRSTNLASLVAKNPTKQGPYEPAAVAYLAAATRAGQPGSPVAAVVQLSRAGVGIRFRANGDWFVSMRQDRTSKSADIAVLVVSPDGLRGRWYLCAHKYARVAGGHQDNQREDAVTFAEYARLGHRHGLMLDPLERQLAQLAPDVLDIDWRPGLILDGAYFAGALPALRTRGEDPLEFVGDTDQWAQWLLSPAAAC